MKLEDVTFYMRERIEDGDGCMIDGSNPFKWVLKRSSDLFAGKRVLVIGLPGAFTPTCSNNQLPGFEAMYDEFIAKGIDEIYCTSVNDSFVMYQWAKAQGVEKIKMLPDGNGDFADSMDMLVSKSNLGFGDRSWRYVAIIDNMRVVEVFEEPGKMHRCPDDPYGVSAPENVIKHLPIPY